MAKSVKKQKTTEIELAREDAKAGRVIEYSGKEKLFEDLGL